MHSNGMKGMLSQKKKSKFTQLHFLKVVPERTIPDLDQRWPPNLGSRHVNRCSVFFIDICTQIFSEFRKNEQILSDLHRRKWMQTYVICIEVTN